MSTLAMFVLGSALQLQMGLSFVPPHRPLPTAAQVATQRIERAQQRGRQLSGANIDELLRAALAETSEALHFGLRHRTSNRFDLREREGNCVEYAQLFAVLFTEIARAAGVNATAQVYRSDALVFGMRLPSAAMRDHDWVLVTDRRSGVARWVDPSFFDAGLGWNVQSVVHGFSRR